MCGACAPYLWVYGLHQLCKRKPDTERAPLTRNTFGGDATTQLLYDGLSNREAKPCSLAGASTISTIEAPKNVGKIIRINADAGVTHAQKGLFLGSFERDDDTSCLSLLVAGRIFERIIEEYKEHPANTLLITLYTYRLNVSNFECWFCFFETQASPELTHQLQDSMVQLNRLISLFL